MADIDVPGAHQAAAGLGGRPSEVIAEFAVVPGDTEYCLLGPLTVRRGGALVTIPAGRQRTVLAALLLSAGRLVRLDELTEAAWGSAPPPSARVSLQNCVARLRKVLGNEIAGPIVTLPGGYLIVVGPDELDVRRFEAALTAGLAAVRAEIWADAARLLREGLGLWRGEPLADIASELLAMREVPRLSELRLQATEARIDADLHLGRHAEVIAELRQLTAAEPLRERLHALLMTALYRAGQRAGALAAYRAARGLLISELGAEPGPELRRVQREILEGDRVPVAEAGARPGIGPGSGEQARHPAAIRSWLPPDTPALTGRDDEINRITAAVSGSAGSARMTAIHVICGMPGVGKTALAVHIAHRLAGRFPDRQLFIDLRGYTPGQDPLSPEAALGGLLAATGTDPRYLPDDLAGRAGLWRDKMAGKRALLILDNAASSAQAAPLLPGGDDCLVLVTSRRHLADLPGSVPVLLEVLRPDQAREMFLLLAPRAAADPPSAVAELTELAGQLPLAIALLARVLSRHPVWTLADLAAETKERLLTLTAEHDSVAAAFEVSWQHLDRGQQEFFLHLRLYPGVTIDAYAAAALAGIPLDQAVRQLDALHGEGLLTETGYRRYGMHDLIRRYVADRAAVGLPGRLSEALGRLLDYYQHTAARAGEFLARQAPGSPGLPPIEPAVAPGLPDADTALAWIRAERSNLLACLDHATRDGQSARVVALTAAIAELLRKDGPWSDAIGRHVTAVLAARRLGDQPGLAAALGNLGTSQRLTGDYLAAATALGEALDIYRNLGDQPGLAATLRELGVERYSVGDYPGAERVLKEALAIFRQLGDQRGQASALHDLGDLLRVAGDLPGAGGVLAEALVSYRELGDRRGQASVLARLGHVRQMTGEYRAAAEDLDEALGLYQEIDDRAGQGSVQINIGAMRLATGDHPGAVLVLQAALDIYRDLGSRTGVATALGVLGAALLAASDYPLAAQTLGQALVIFCELGDRGAQAQIHNDLGAVHHAQSRLQQASDSHRLALGLAREIGSSWDEGHALAGLGRCALAEGDLSGAAAGLRQARDIFAGIGAAETAGLAAELTALTRRPDGDQ
jgi:DNA-binding SARP family transcriptional activator